MIEAAGLIEEEDAIPTTMEFLLLRGCHRHGSTADEHTVSYHVFAPNDRRSVAQDASMWSLSPASGRSRPMGARILSPGRQRRDRVLRLARRSLASGIGGSGRGALAFIGRRRRPGRPSCHRAPRLRVPLPTEQRRNHRRILGSEQSILQEPAPHFVGTAPDNEKRQPEGCRFVRGVVVDPMR